MDYLAVMITMTTYGTWVRGDSRGWVSNGITYPRDPEIEAADRRRMKHPMFVFSADELVRVGEMIGTSLRQRLEQHILALTVQTWHVHFMVGASQHSVPDIVKCAKDAVRWGLRPNQPIWTDGYDKRFCFDDDAVHKRIAYVERHNTAVGLPAKPWGWIEMPD